MSEVCLMTCFYRDELTWLALGHIRKADPNIPVAIFADRGYSSPDLTKAAETFDARLITLPEHKGYGNTRATMEAYKWAAASKYECTYLVENDCMVHPDFFDWHREMHSTFDDIFASCAWVFNQTAPISKDASPLFAPWFYSIGVCFALPKLRQVALHASDRYYENMAAYIREIFPESKLPTRSRFGIEHWEQDGLIQRVLEDDGSQVAWPSVAKVDHLGFGSANQGRLFDYEDFFRTSTFESRLDELRVLLTDKPRRVELFGRSIVERELGERIPLKTDEPVYECQGKCGQFWAKPKQAPAAAVAVCPSCMARIGRPMKHWQILMPETAEKWFRKFATSVL